MTTWVMRDGRLVDKSTAEPLQFAESANFARPAVSRMTPFESPIDGREISTWRERDADMKAADAYDLRDLPKDHQFKRGRQAVKDDDGRRTEPFWRD